MSELWQPWAVAWDREAARQLDPLDARLKRRVRQAVHRYAETGHGDIRRLEGYDPPVYAQRVGDWRMRFVFDYAAHTIVVLRVLPRGRAYHR